MTKRDIVLGIHFNPKHKTTLTQAQTRSIIDAFTDIVKDSVADGQTVIIRGFGVFQPKHQKPKLCRDIKQGISFTRPACTYPVFTPSKLLKQDSLPV